jgi:hypothetical protein
MSRPPSSVREVDARGRGRRGVTHAQLRERRRAATTQVAPSPREQGGCVAIPEESWCHHRGAARERQAALAREALGEPALPEDGALARQPLHVRHRRGRARHRRRGEFLTATPSGTSDRRACERDTVASSMMTSTCRASTSSRGVARAPSTRTTAASGRRPSRASAGGRGPRRIDDDTRISSRGCACRLAPARTPRAASRSSPSQPSSSSGGAPPAACELELLLPSGCLLPRPPARRARPVRARVHVAATQTG